MNISPAEAEEALAAIEAIAKKTRRAVSDSGAYKFLIIWGFAWLIGFLSSHFLQGDTAGYVWMGVDILGGIISIVVGARMNRGVRSPSGSTAGKRIAWFWLLIFLFCASAIGVISPADGKTVAMLIILFVMIGWMAMALLLSFSSVLWGLAITALALIGYFLLPDFFYLLMAFLGGGGMIVLGLIIRKRW